MDVDGTTAPPVASPVRAAVHAAGYAAECTPPGTRRRWHAVGVHERGAAVFNDYLMWAMHRNKTWKLSSHPLVINHAVCDQNALTAEAGASTKPWPGNTSPPARYSAICE